MRSAMGRIARSTSVLAALTILCSGACLPSPAMATPWSTPQQIGPAGGVGTVQFTAAGHGLVTANPSLEDQTLSGFGISPGDRFGALMPLIRSGQSPTLGSAVAVYGRDRYAAVATKGIFDFQVSQ